MESYQATVKMEQNGNAGGAFQVNVDHIQSELDELVKSLNEHCKKYGLLGKPTTLTELPFGIQVGAADWDENWDEFEDEGFTFVKELTLDVQNVIAPPKQKSILPQNKEAATVESPTTASSPNADVKSDDLHNADERAWSWGMGSVFSGDKSFDEPAWDGTFDTDDDIDSVWGFNSTGNTKDMDDERNNDDFFGYGEFGLSPMQTESSQASGFSHGTPLYNFSYSPP